MDPYLIIAAAGAAVTAGSYVWIQSRQDIVIYDYQSALKYRDGRLVGELGPGRHRVSRKREHVTIHDLRRQTITMAGQEILTKDSVAVRISVFGTYAIADAKTMVAASQDIWTEFHTAGQMALRGLIAGLTLEELLAGRPELDAQLKEQVAPVATGLGLTLLTLAVRDVMLPAQLKRAMQSVVEAQKSAQAALETARGEAAVLRSLANTAKMYDGNPSLLQARLLQAVSEGGNSIVFGADGLTARPAPGGK